MTTRKTTTPKRTENSGTSQREYWESLSRSFNKQFIDEARKKYDTRKRLQVA